MKYILIIVLCLIIATVYFITRPEPVFEAGKSRTVESTQQKPVASADSSKESNTADTEIAQRRVAMEAEFEKLEKARRNLESRLNRLKAIFWGVEMPKEKHDEISNQMKNGYMLLKNKKLVGAYNDVSQISHELAQIEYINEYLQKVEEEYRSKRLQEE